jgi:hypothetical protein
MEPSLALERAVVAPPGRRALAGCLQPAGYLVLLVGAHVLRSEVVTECHRGASLSRSGSRPILVRSGYAAGRRRRRRRPSGKLLPSPANRASGEGSISPSSGGFATSLEGSPRPRPSCASCRSREKQWRGCWRAGFRPANDTWTDWPRRPPRASPRSRRSCNASRRCGHSSRKSGPLWGAWRSVPGSCGQAGCAGVRAAEPSRGASLSSARAAAGRRRRAARTWRLHPGSGRRTARAWPSGARARSPAGACRP